MKEQFRRVILSATLALVIVYYFVRLFSVLYVFPAQTSIKSRPAIEQAHLKAEEKRLQRYENTSR